jgi:hypothetical protein
VLSPFWHNSTWCHNPEDHILHNQLSKPQTFTSLPHFQTDNPFKTKPILI